MGDNSELLRMELDEIYSFARHHFQLYLAWYTFFLTVNFAAVGWCTSVLLTGQLKVSLPIVFIAIFFIVQLVFSYFAVIEVRKYFITADGRCCEVLQLLSKADEPRLQPKTVIPIGIYVRLTDLMRFTLMSFVVFWLALAVLAVYAVPPF